LKAFEFCIPTKATSGPSGPDWLQQGEIGPDLFRAGRSPNWIKVKNRKHPAMERVMESLL
jgi:hypothetical protein